MGGQLFFSQFPSLILNNINNPNKNKPIYGKK